MMLPVNIAPLRNTPLGPEKPGPEKPVRAPGRAVPVKQSISPGVRMAVPATYRRGGRVKRTGLATVHKDEHVLPAAGSLGKGTKKRIKKIYKAAKAKAKKAE